MKKVFIHILLLACCFGLTMCTPEFTMEDVLFVINVGPNDWNRGDVTITGDGQYHYGEEVTLTATSINRYVFVEWSDKVKDNPRKIIVSQDTTLIARFGPPAAGMANGHEYIDLGLPSGMLWATCNVGANSPEDYGNYYAWAETTVKTEYSWGTYKYCNGTHKSLTKYCTNADYGYSDRRTILTAEDDAATINWGGDWRTPTEDELEELYYYCTWTWWSNNGKKGYRVVGENGNSIFLPAASCLGDSAYEGVGACGYYWASSLFYILYPDLAVRLNFDSEHYGIYRDDRYIGGTVRPVRSPK